MTAPLLRWAGSKKKLLPTLVSAAPQKYLRYIEPFAGSAILYLRLPRTAALLGDINPDLISTYRTVMEHPKRVWSRVAGLPTSADFYYDLRAVAPDSLGKIDRAARFVYLNRFCFNGVYRTNRQGAFNVSRGHGRLFVPPYEVFRDFADKLSTAALHCGDFEPLVDKARAGDFLYLDPPYRLDGKRDRGEYGLGAFRESDEERLVDAVVRASNRGAKVLLSYSRSPALTARFKDWNIKHLTVARNVSGFTAARRKASEVLVSNYDWAIRATTTQ